MGLARFGRSFQKVRPALTRRSHYSRRPLDPVRGPFAPRAPWEGEAATYPARHLLVRGGGQAHGQVAQDEGLGHTVDSHGLRLALYEFFSEEIAGDEVLHHFVD